MELLVSLQEQLGQYEDKWVAILERIQTIVGSGNDAYEVKLDAEANGYPDIELFKVAPVRRGSYLTLSDIPLRDD